MVMHLLDMGFSAFVFCLSCIAFALVVCGVLAFEGLRCSEFCFTEATQSCNCIYRNVLTYNPCLFQSIYQVWPTLASVCFPLSFLEIALSVLSAIPSQYSAWSETAYFTTLFDSV